MLKKVPRWLFLGPRVAYSRAGPGWVRVSGRVGCGFFGAGRVRVNPTLPAPGHGVFAGF